MHQQGFTTIDLMVLILYLLLVLAVAMHFAKGDKKGKDYFKGDGTIPWWVTSFSIFAALFSPISFLSLAGNSFKGTWLMWFAAVGNLLAIPVAIKFFLPVYSKLRIDTAYHYLELRFGSKGLRVLGASTFIFYQLGRMAIVMYLPCMVLSKLMNLNASILPLLMGGAAILYSYFGGLKSVLWADFMQGAVLLFGVVFAFVFLVFHLDGGMGSIFHELIANHKFLAADEPILNLHILKDSVLLMLVGAGMNTLGSYVSSQDIVQRFTTTTDTRKLNKMMVTNGLLCVGVGTIFYFIGTGLHVFYNVDGNPLPPAAEMDQIFASWIAFELPIGIAGLLLAAIFGAAQSALSAGLNSVSSSWTLDVQACLSKKQLSDEKATKIGQRVSLIVGVFAVLFAMVLTHGGIESAYQWFSSFMGLVLGVLMGVFFLGVFTKRGNVCGAVCGFVASAAVMIYVVYGLEPGTVSIWANALIALAAALGVGYPASLIYSLVTGKGKAAPANTTVYNIEK